MCKIGLNPSNSFWHRLVDCILDVAEWREGGGDEVVNQQPPEYLLKI